MEKLIGGVANQHAGVRREKGIYIPGLHGLKTCSQKQRQFQKKMLIGLKTQQKVIADLESFAGRFENWTTNLECCLTNLKMKS